jgi:hypothetical protein
VKNLPVILFRKLFQAFQLQPVTPKVVLKAVCDPENLRIYSEKNQPMREVREKKIP